MTTIRCVAWGIGVLVLLGTGLGCERRASTPVSVEEMQAEVGPEHESWGTRFFVSEDGLPRIQIVSAYLAEYESEDSTYMLLTGDSLMARVTVFLFDAAGDSSAVLTSDQVLYYDHDRRFEAQGDVVVVTKEGKRLESEHLLWFENERKVRTPGFVRITTPSERIQGYNLESDEDLATYVLKRVTGMVTMEEE